MILCIRICIHLEHACIFYIILVIKYIYQSFDLAGFTISYQFFAKKKKKTIIAFSDLHNISYTMAKFQWGRLGGTFRNSGLTIIILLSTKYRVFSGCPASFIALSLLL